MKTVTIEGVEIELTPEQIKQIVAAKKPSPEQYLIDILNKLTGRVYEGKQMWYLEDQWVFEVDYKNKKLWCHYWTVWEKFYHYNDMKDEEIKQLMQTVVCKALNLEGFTPLPLGMRSDLMVCKALNLEGFTPASLRTLFPSKVCKALNLEGFALA